MYIVPDWFIFIPTPQSWTEKWSAIPDGLARACPLAPVGQDHLICDMVGEATRPLSLTGTNIFVQ
jgi:hypothetical protein